MLRKQRQFQVNHISVSVLRTARDTEDYGVVLVGEDVNSKRARCFNEVHHLTLKSVRP
jgi:hypothetical protein